MGNNIASERVRAGLTQPQLAERLGLDISTVLRMEKDRAPVTGDRLVAMASIFGCSTDYLLGLTDERLPAGR